MQTDGDLHIRTVVIGMCPRDSLEKSLPYTIKNLYCVKLSVKTMIVKASFEELLGAAQIGHEQE